MTNRRSAEPVTELFGEPISVYTRAQAIKDGVLVDAGSMASEAGFRWPTALTAAAWADCVAWGPDDNRRQVHQDQAGRLWDVLSMAAHAIRSNRVASDRVLFPLRRVPRDGRSTEPELTQLRLVVGPGDAGEPVMTILLPHED
jgi:hypothetical protein